MAENYYLISGIVLLLLVMYDFFFTTLSGSGAGFISKNVANFSHKIMQLVVKLFGRSSYGHSGLLVNLKVLAVWVGLVWMGLFLIYSSNPEAIINGNGRVANNWERLYFTGYTLSTLGIGNLKPTTAFFEILTSCFSFFWVYFLYQFHDLFSFCFFCSYKQKNSGKKYLESREQTPKSS